LVNWVWGPD